MMSVGFINRNSQMTLLRFSVKAPLILIWNPSNPWVPKTLEKLPHGHGQAPNVVSCFLRFAIRFLKGTQIIL